MISTRSIDGTLTDHPAFSSVLEPRFEPADSAELGHAGHTRATLARRRSDRRFAQRASQGEAKGRPAQPREPIDEAAKARPNTTSATIVVYVCIGIIVVLSVKLGGMVLVYSTGAIAVLAPLGFWLWWIWALKFSKGAKLVQRANEGDAEGAIRDLEWQIQERGPDANRLNDLAVLWMSRQQYAKALPLLRQACEMAPDQPLYRSNLAVALRETGELEESENLLAEATLDKNVDSLYLSNHALVLALSWSVFRGGGQAREGRGEESLEFPRTRWPRGPGARNHDGPGKDRQA